VANPSKLDQPQDNGQAPKVAREHRPGFIQKMMRALAEETESKEKVKQIPNDQIFKSRYPNLWDWVTATQISDKWDKDPARLTFSIDGTVWRVSLTDAALELSLAATGDSFDTALARLDALVVDPEASWNKWRKRTKALRAREVPKKD